MVFFLADAHPPNVRDLISDPSPTLGDVKTEPRPHITTSFLRGIAAGSVFIFNGFFCHIWQQFMYEYRNYSSSHATGDIAFAFRVVPLSFDNFIIVDYTTGYT